MEKKLILCCWSREQPVHELSFFDKKGQHYGQLIKSVEQIILNQLGRTQCQSLFGLSGAFSLVLEVFIFN